MVSMVSSVGRALHERSIAETAQQGGCQFQRLPMIADMAIVDDGVEAHIFTELLPDACREGGEHTGRPAHCCRPRPRPRQRSFRTFPT